MVQKKYKKPKKSNDPNHAKKLLYFVLDNSSIHGLRFLSDKNNLSTRILWLIICAVSMWGLSFIIRSVWNDYRSQSISYVLDTEYLNWNTTFPAIFVCPAASTRIGVGGNKGKIEDSVGKFTYESTKYVNCDLNPDVALLCQNIDHDALMNSRFEKNISKVIEEVTFLNIPYDETILFKPIRTQRGPCFVANAYEPETGPNFDKLLKCNRSTGPAALKFRLLKKATIFIMSPEAVPVVTTEVDLSINSLSDNQENVILATEIVNDRDIPKQSFEHRLCRFPNEIPPNVRPFGSYSAETCQMDCMRRFDMAAANCTTHLMPEIFRKDYCGYKGLQIISDLTAYKYEDYGIECDCLRSCCDNTYELLVNAETPKEDDSIKYAYINIRMVNLPVIRYVRKVMMSSMDFAVSVGGTAGLFFGVSMISIVEVIYLCFIYKFKGKS